MATRSKFSAFLLLAGVNLGLATLFVGGIELAFGNWFAPYVPPRVVDVNGTYIYRQTLYEPPSEVVYRRDKYGLRGVHLPVLQVELVTVGGSTTDQRYLTEGETWQDELGALSGVVVANAGADGMSSFGHVVAVTEWLHAIPDLSPKYYLHYIGLNDASLSLDPRQHVFDRSGITTTSWRLAIQRRSAIMHTVEMLRSRRPRQVAHGASTPMPDAEMIAVDVDHGAIDLFIETVYKPNLRKLMSLHRQRSETTIFVSQAVHPSLVQWRDGKTFVAAHARDFARYAVTLQMINAATQATCRESADVCHFFDLAQELRFEAQDFYDPFHATPAGARKIGAFLAKELDGIRGGSAGR
jgi:hypothetical protein